MENLILSGSYQIGFHKNDKVIGYSADAIGDRLFALGRSGHVKVVDRSSFAALTEVKEDPLVAKVNVKSFRYNEESGANAIAISEEGDFFSIKTNAAGLIESECMAKLDEGVSAAAWSPDGDICAVITKTKKPQLMLITSKLDTVVEKMLFAEDEPPESTAVTVGWGKKETQFHASEGKSAAFTAQQQPTPVHPLDDRDVRIAWRPDGQNFVVHFVNPVIGGRDFRVYNRNGSLFSLMEPTSGVGQAIVWRSFSVAGFIATSCLVAGNKATIQFFEKNGLRHGSFNLPFDSNAIHVRELHCNPDGKLLFVTCEDQQSSQERNVYVLVYSTVNFHWYLKQTILFPREAFGNIWLDGADKPYRLHVAYNDSLITYEWNWCVDRHEKHNCVAVVDGRELLLTPYKLCAPPPPMCHVRCQLPRPVSAFAFCTELEAKQPKLRFAVVALDGFGYFYEYDYRNLENEPKLVNSFNCAEMLGFRFLSVTEATPEKFFGTYVTTGDSGSVVHVFSPSGGFEPSHIEVKGTITAFRSAADGKTSFLQTDDGKLYAFNVETRSVVPLMNPESFPRVCSQLRVAYIQNEPVVVGLAAASSKGGPLYFGNFQFSASATSLAVDDRYLAFTTTEHRAYFVPLSWKSLEGLYQWFIRVTSGPSTPLQALITRPVERGAVVVAIDTLGDGSVVLQMPRGNVEKINPRPLLLEAVVQNVNQKHNYRKAFNICLKHRISLNLLYDLNPELFESDPTHFCKQLATADNLNLFILELSEYNVVETLYPSTAESTATTKSRQVSSKIDNICEILLETIKLLDECGLYLATLTCYAKRKFGTDLESAVTYLKELASRNPEVKSTLLDSGLKHLARLADVNDLYDVALGTYDLDLALTVAERTQKDPREYRQELTDFSHLQPIAYRQYRIDRRVGKLEAAVRHLIEAGESYFSELFEYVTVEKPKMLALAAKLVEQNVSDDDKVKKVWGAYVAQAASEKRYLEAGVCALRIGLFEDAIDPLLRSKSWDLAAVAASRLGGRPSAVLNGIQNEDEPLRHVAESAAESNELSWAGNAYESLLEDSEMALNSYLGGHDLLRAYKVLSVRMSKSLGEIRTVLEPAITNSLDHQLSTLNEAVAELNEFIERIQAIDKTRHATVAFPYGDAELAAGDAESIAAVSTTASSAMRSMTSRSSSRSTSSRSSRHSRWRLKAGSPSERFAIMERLVAYARDRLPQWRQDASDLFKVFLLVVEPKVLWDRQENKVNLLLTELQQTFAALRQAVELGWSSDYIASLQDEFGDGCDDTSKANSSGLALLDERIRYSPMCLVYIEEGRIATSKSTSIYSVIFRLVS